MFPVAVMVGAYARKRLIDYRLGVALLLVATPTSRISRPD